MKRLIAALACAAALILTGCSPIGSGTVTGKDYQAAYSYTTTTCTAYSSKGYCIAYVPIVNNVPERFRLDLRDGKDEGWVYVDGITWHEYEVGDRYPKAGR